MNLQTTFKELCTPAKIYFAIALLSAIFVLSRGVSFGVVFVRFLFGILWTFILGWLCKKGYTSLSWFLVLLPYVVLLLATLRIVNIVQHKKLFKSVGLQGAYGMEPFGTQNAQVGTTAMKDRQASRAGATTTTTEEPV